MREIKFRAWDKNGKGFINGFNMIGFSTGQGAPTKKLQRFSTYWNMDDVEIMQYTGLKDKNGKEIYEGDIVKNIKTGKMYTIKWHGVFAGFIYDDTAFNHSHKSEWGELYLCYMKLEVIGNIYKNPELMR